METTNMTVTLIHEAINEDYEWIQYNDQLRIIRSIKDDMYNMKSIINACHSKKKPNDWFKNQSTQELIDEFERMEDDNVSKRMTEIRNNVSVELRGHYVHRLLVNAVAMWASPRYAAHIHKMLDKLAKEERDRLSNKIETMKPRQVPANKQKNYKYMIWKEAVEDDEDQIKLHLVRRSHRVFSQVNYIRNDPDKCWFFRDNLPIAMTPNENVKALIKKLLPGSDYSISQSTVITYKKHLPLLLEEITTYFNEFQN